MAPKEATARIKINHCLQAAGWRFFDSPEGSANIVLEPNVKLTETDLAALGNDLEKAKNGFIDFLLLGDDGKPLVVLEAKSEGKNPLSGKEQARKYARSQNARFVILSNGNIHYLWDLEQGNPTVISAFPGPADIGDHYAFTPDAERLANEPVDLDYIALTQMPGYAQEAGWKVEAERPAFIEKAKLRFLRRYQQRAIERVQEDAKKGATRFLFEMATGTGKTLTAAAIIKLFLKTGNARRVLFLVDRLELEVQADKAFKAYLRNDFTSVIYKERRDDWRKADIVVTTVQSLLFNDKYRGLFAPTDFDLVISDEAHRSIGGKVPDPKSQVEQITIALIYKFMDDMDLEAEELGGERRFFTKDYERYRWAKLVAAGVSGQDMLNTYSEALTKMVENESLPKLFRDIFRNAYLPYRDPETLRAFLREIDTFTYDHSERLGDAFEYLLSVLGSQGDAGQFRTPRHIIDFMVEIIDPKKTEVILDPACGTAGFLISAYKHILKQNSTGVTNGNATGTEGDAAEQALESPMRYPGDLLQPDDRTRLARNIKGYDISPDMVRLSLVNLYLHGFADPKVEEYDTLTSQDKWTEMADVILAKPGAVHLRIECFTDPVLHRLARRDEVPVDARLLAPGQHRVRGELGAMIADD